MKDACNNESKCSFVITVVDAKNQLLIATAVLPPP
ncbi:MAG: hypothetical protein IPG87_15875 [Saprospiraceae bacterium]|nr:hypothetical protein [Candidatus Vicinibacter affinis]